MSKEVADIKEEGFAPIDMSQDAGQGFDNMSSQDMAVPFFSLLQRMSPQIEAVENAKPGMIINTATQTVYDKIHVIPCAYERVFIEWKPRDSGGGFVGIHQINSETVTNAIKDEKGNLTLSSGTILVETAQHYVMVLTPDGIINGIITMTKTQLKKSRLWNSMMAALTMTNDKGEKYTPPRFSHIYELSSVDESNELGAWKSWKIEIFEPVVEPKIYQQVKQFAELTNRGEVKVIEPQQENQ